MFLKVTLALLFYACCAIIGGDAEVDFKLEDCSNSDAWFKLKSVRVSPYPIVAPGDLTLAASVQILKDLAGANVDVQLTIKRKVLIWVKVPCVNKVGSCKYDVCQFMKLAVDTNKGKCPSFLAADNIPCTCSTIKPGVYSISDQKIEIKLPKAISALAHGDYKLDVSAVDRTTGKQVGCMTGQMSLVEPGAKKCTGFFCGFLGGK